MKLKYWAYAKVVCFLIVLLWAVSCTKETVNLSEETLKYNQIDAHLRDALDGKNTKEDRLQSVDKAHVLYRTLSATTSEKLQKIEDISSAYYELKQYETSAKMDRKALDLANTLKDSMKIAKFYGYFGIYYRDKEKLDSAYINFHKADKIYSNLERSTTYEPQVYAFEHGKILIDLANLSRKVKDYSKSEDLTVRAIKKFELSEDYSYIPLSYTNLGTVAKELERYRDAVSYYKKAIEHSKKISKDTLFGVLGNNNIGTVYKSQQKYAKAIEYYNKALKYKPFLNKRPKKYARLLDNLGYVQFLANPDDPEAFALFQKAYAIRDSLYDVVGLSTNNLHLAEYYKTMGNDSLAIVYGIKAQEAASATNNNVELLQAYDILSEVSESEQGLAYAQQYINLNDSLVKMERAYVNKFARIEFETEEKVQKIEKISRENQILIITVLGITVLSLLGYIIFRQQQRNKELLFEQKQQQANQEIYRLLLSQQTKLEEGRKMEQQRMSEELHDGVLGRLFGVRLSLDGINQRVNDGYTETRTKYIEELKSIEREIRLISHDLGTETLSTDVAYVDVVENLIFDLCEAHKLQFEFESDEAIDWDIIDNQKKVNLFRIVQESLQNIFKHAQAKNIKISFDYVDDTINLTILDDGIGFKATKVKKGIGLKNITSRVRQMNGVVDFISNNEEIPGTKVTVGVPI